jgi:hypothetical protein
MRRKLVHTEQSRSRSRRSPPFSSWLGCSRRSLGHRLVEISLPLSLQAAHPTGNLSLSLSEISLPLPPSLSLGRHPHALGVICAERHPSGRRRPPPPPDGLLAEYRLTEARWANLLYGPPWAYYLGGYQDRLLGGPLGLPDLSCTTPDGVEHKDYSEGVLG